MSTFNPPLTRHSLAAKCQGITALILAGYLRDADTGFSSFLTQYKEREIGKKVQCIPLENVQATFKMAL
ncbi:MAG: hypothetical protein IKE29_12925 [Paenibacillus sp.]|uniref:hypothetical protein n=1 Tax=Paenibacillus sp. TaxID=58172 RepID=UPI0025DA2B7A|nr:hypothetical protein [Paenibacillus sp.]MBR2565512.1 hypothetical protein [Paenibacillus sp.]